MKTIKHLLGYLKSQAGCDFYFIFRGKTGIKREQSL